MSKEEYKVSIVLPVYNGEQYLAIAIESILQQTYKNIELIIIDDCSTDKSNQIARSYAKRDARIRVYKNRENKKLPRSLNAGFGMATGDLYTWTSDDNILKPETIETLVHVFEEKKNVDFVYADIIPIDENGNIIKNCRAYLNGEIEDIYVRNIIQACFMYKREIHESLKGYNTKLFLCEDYDFWVRTFENGFQMYHLKRKLYYYRIHNNSLTATKKKENAIIAMKLLYRNLFKEKKVRNKLKIVSRIKNHLKTVFNENRKV